MLQEHSLSMMLQEGTYNFYLQYQRCLKINLHYSNLVHLPSGPPWLASTNLLTLNVNQQLFHYVPKILYMKIIHKTVKTTHCKRQQFLFIKFLLTPNTLGLIPINRRSTFILKQKSKQTSYKSIGEKEGKITAHETGNKVQTTVLT